jgi:AcrR family transcriptional regulator
VTRHRSKEEWIEHIFQAATDEIEENGYVSFSMEAVVRRTELSKGGVYRFFKNRRDLAMKLFESLYDPWLSFDIDACMALGLTAEETCFNVMYKFNNEGGEISGRQIDRLWLRLIPEVLDDAHFRAVHEQQTRRIQEKFAELVARLAEREGIIVDDAFRAKARESVEIGTGLMEGFSIQNALGCTMDQHAVLTRRFINGMMADLLQR